ncbi:MAG: HAD-IA family hydrolase [Leptospiraceae bacterium]|nr:HAD-IA family hydrolase [Leptospiraceae bacterium]
MKLVFIDLDGTLEDSRDDMAHSVNRVRNSFQLPPHSHDFNRQNVNRGMEQLYRSCFAELFSSDAHVQSALEDASQDADTLMRIQRAYEQDYARHIIDSTRLYTGMDAALRRIAQHHTLVCFTNKPEALSRLLLEKLAIGDCFSDVMGGDSCSESKPSALPMRIAAERLRFDSKRDSACMIGDTVGDMRAGRSFGATTIWCAWGYLDAPPGEPKPDWQATQPADIPDLLNRIFQ